MMRPRRPAPVPTAFAGGRGWPCPVHGMHGTAHVHMALGQQAGDAEIKAIVDKFNALPCFTSRQIVPAIVSAQRFAGEAMPGYLSTLQAGGDYLATERRTLQGRWDLLEYWRKRLSTEPEKKYCQGTTDGVRSSDRQQIQDAVVGPYIEASGIAGAQAVLAAARAQLLSDLTLGISEGKPPWYLDMKYLGAIFVGAIALGIYQRVKGTGATSPEEKTLAPKAAPSVPSAPSSPSVEPPVEAINVDRLVHGDAGLPPPPQSKPSGSFSGLRPWQHPGPGVAP